MTLAVELRNVTKSFDEILALDNINLRLFGGEIFGLLGANGSGKTTLLKILALIEKPSKGEVYFDSEKVTERNASLKRLEATMVFQKTTLFSTTVRDNIAYGLKVRKTQKTVIDEKVRNALRLVKLEGFEKRQAKKLSGGEQQRVALARALVLNTKLLLLDEPTANLDPKNASVMEEIVSSINREHQTTIVVASHNMFQAKNLPRRIALMKDGRIAEVGTPDEIFGNLSKALASFALTSNVFRGEAWASEDGVTIVDIGNSVHLETTSQAQGTVSVFVNSKEIILSEERFASSARNVLKGRIVEVSDLGSIVQLKVDVGKVLMVQITKRSFNEMRLNLNKEVYVAFKASSVQII